MLGKTQTNTALAVMTLVLMAFTVGCGDDGGGEGEGGNGGMPVDTPPSADAGMSQEVVEDSVVTLSGTATAGTNPIASVAWTQTSGPSVTLNDADTDNPSFIAPKAAITETETLEFEYTVTDTMGGTDSDSVSVAVSSDDFVIFIADKDTLGVLELYKSDVESGTVTKLSGPLVAGGAVASFAISPNGQYVAYVADQDTDTVLELYVARTDGSGVVKANGPLVAGGSVSSLPAWAPDSSRIAYVADQDTDNVAELYTSLPDGTGNAQVNGSLVAGGTVSPFSRPAWAPDSSRIAYVADQDTDNVQELYTSLPDGTGNVKASGTLVAGGNVAEFPVPAWAPDSSRIAYVADQDTDTVQELYTSLPDGTGNVKASGTLVAGGAISPFSPPAWAPDSSRIAYVADQDTDNVAELYTSLPDGTVNVRVNGTLVAGGGVSSVSTWAPDSSRLAYVADQDTDTVQELYTSLPDGTGNVKVSGTLVAGGSVSPNPGAVWAPDSSQIAYVADQDTDNVIELYASLPDGTGNVKISAPVAPNSNAALNGDPSIPGNWAPDSSLVSYVVSGISIQIPGFAASTDGSGATQYTGTMDPAGTGLQFWPKWSADSSRLIYVAQQDSLTRELYLVAPDGTQNENISGPIVAGGNVNTNFYEWSP